MSAVVTGDYQGRVILWDVHSTGDGTFLEQRHSSSVLNADDVNADDVERRSPMQAPRPTWQHDSKTAISSIAFCDPEAATNLPSDHDQTGALQVLCSDVDGGIAVLTLVHNPAGLDRLVFDHWFGSVTKPEQSEVDVSVDVVKTISTLE